MGRVTGAQNAPKGAPTGTGLIAWTKRTANQKLYSIFLEKSQVSKGQCPWSPTAVGETLNSFRARRGLQRKKARHQLRLMGNSAARYFPDQPHPGDSIAGNLSVLCRFIQFANLISFFDSLQRQTPPVSGGSLSYSVSSPCSFSFRSNSVDATATNRAQGRDA